MPGHTENGERFEIDSKKTEPFDYWAGRVIDALAGVGIASTLIAICVFLFVWNEL